MISLPKKEWNILLFCVLIGFALRFYTFDEKSLWTDEVYTFNDSRYGIKDQLTFYKENPTFLHPPLFFLLTHLFYPFENPERDLRIIPLIFGTLSIPMSYLLARQFSASIAIPCTLSLAFMTYHISLSQEGRSYSILLFLGMVGLYFFLKHLNTSKTNYLILAAFVFSISLYTTYSSFPFIVFSQILWFYKPQGESEKPKISSFFILNGSIFIFCLPWALFLISNYRGQPVMDPAHTEGMGSFLYIVWGVFHDWAPHIPLTLIAVLLFILFPFVVKHKKNALVLLTAFILPISGLYFFCKLFNLKHFITSRYFINLLPFFFVILFLSVDTLELKLGKLNKYFRPKLFLLILIIASNLIILPLYYGSEKQDFKGLVSYMKNRLRAGDKIVVGSTSFFSPILHYFDAHPTGRHQLIERIKVSDEEIEYRKPLNYQNINAIIIYSKSNWFRYLSDGSRLWIVSDKTNAKRLKEKGPFVLKGYFDGSFLNFNRFPTDVSMYLLLWDPESPGEKGIELPIP